MLTIGVLGIQGAVSEHMECIERLGHRSKQVMYPADFEGLDGLILPGGESTTMAIVCEESGLFPSLRKWVGEKKPTYGTCAGMILLSDHAIKTADGGQSLLGGLDVHVCRNYFGSQIYSTTVEVEQQAAPASSSSSSSTSFPAVFIRAPAILRVGSDVEVLAKMEAPPHRSARRDVLNLLGLNPDELVTTTGSTLLRAEDMSERFSVIIAVKQDNILATAFHPELTQDLRWHQLFIDMCSSRKS